MQGKGALLLFFPYRAVREGFMAAALRRDDLERRGNQIVTPGAGSRRAVLPPEGDQGGDQGSFRYACRFTEPGSVVHPEPPRGAPQSGPFRPRGAG